MTVIDWDKIRPLCNHFSKTETEHCLNRKYTNHLPILASYHSVKDRCVCVYTHVNIYTLLLLPDQIETETKPLFLDSTHKLPKCVGPQSCPILCDTWTVVCKAPLFMGFFRQEYSNELPFPLAGDLPEPGTKPTSLTSPALQVDSLLLSHQVSHLTQTKILEVPYGISISFSVRSLSLCHTISQLWIDTFLLVFS